MDLPLDDIPGLLGAGLFLEGRARDGSVASVLCLRDGAQTSLLDLSGGLDPAAPGLTRAMRSYVSGLVEVGDYLATRRKTDEDGVTAADIERAALALAFPRLSGDAAALETLARHLHLLQGIGVLTQAPVREPDAPVPDAVQPEPVGDGGEETPPAGTDPSPETPEPPPSAGTRGPFRLSGLLRR
jgi:hypothetical protein